MDWGVKWCILAPTEGRGDWGAPRHRRCTVPLVVHQRYLLSTYTLSLSILNQRGVYGWGRELILICWETQLTLYIRHISIISILQDWRKLNLLCVGFVYFGFILVSVVFMCEKFSLIICKQQADTRIYRRPPKVVLCYAFKRSHWCVT